VKLSRLIACIEPKKVTPPSAHLAEDSDPEINSIHYRSQTVKPGGLFVAIAGHQADGHNYIDDAAARGAVAVISEKPVHLNHAVVIAVNSSRRALASISSRFYTDPSSRLCIIGVTGTNGKTTTTYLIESMLEEAGFKVGVVGTINYRYDGKIFSSPMTTPESLELQEMLHEMESHQVTHVVMEVSSHAIDLCRVENCWFDIGVFTNLSQDHLDYHKDMDAYGACKKRFFTDFLTSGPKKDKAVAVINCDDAQGNSLYRALASKKISVGVMENAMVRLNNVKSDCDGISGEILSHSEKTLFHSPLVGAYNAENIACAAGAAVALNQKLQTVSAGITNMRAVPGRLEKVRNDCGRFVYVDYAHTPDALDNALKALDAVKTSKLICIFGCGGNRDVHKRPRMGEIAGKWCDLAVITTDNPRNEAPEDIIRQVEHGVKKTMPHQYVRMDLSKGIQQKGYVIEADRKEAIGIGIKAALPGDVVLIAGKGHETYQIIGSKTYPFDDRQVAEEILKTTLHERLS
jgi:UDP-N-acetylmuramoyl-L-alanyl-D-glutamate--2,6-diaminopimelate ligase